MTALCQSMEDTFVPSFEGIDPPLLDPLMVEHFKKQQSSSPQPPTPQQQQHHHHEKVQAPRVPNLAGLSLDDLIKLVTQLCETDPTLSEQIISALNLELPEPQFPPSTSSYSGPAIEPAVPLPDTNTILKTLNQSLLLQEYNNALLPTSLALQLAASTSLSQMAATNGTDTNQSPVLFNSDAALEAMKSNLFVMEKAANKFIPMSSSQFRRPGPKYSRKNFSPEQIEGLEAAFQVHRFVKKDLRKQLAKELSLSERSISYWFQNKRARSKPPITMSSEAALRRAAEQQQAQHLAEQEQSLST